MSTARASSSAHVARWARALVRWRRSVVGVGVALVRSVSSVVGGVADGAIARAGDEGGAIGGERDVYARRRRGRYGVRGAREGARGV